MWKPCAVAVLAVAVLLPSASAWAEVRQAELAFTVETAGTPWSLSFNEATDEWAVLYRDTQTVRFYSPTGQLLRTHTPDLTMPPTLSGDYSNPGLCDLIGGSWTPTSSYRTLLGNPDAALPPEWLGAPEYHMKLLFPQCDYVTDHTDFTPSAIDLVFDGDFRMARYETIFDEAGAQYSGAEVGLGQTGQKMFLWEQTSLQLPDGSFVGSASMVVPLADWGVTSTTQSVTIRGEDYSPVVLCDNEVSIFKRPLHDYLPTPLYSDKDVGDLLEHWTIEGLPVGASLIDIDEIRPILTPRADGGTFYVLDQTTGGVYALTPEPCSLALLGLGLLGLAARRRSAAK